MTAAVASDAALRRRTGFRVIGTLECIGRHQGVWRDLVLVEHRSPQID